jgi:integrase
MIKKMDKKTFTKPKKDFSSLLESKYVKKWIDSYSNGQKQARLGVLARYCNFVDKNPDKVLIEHKEDIHQENPLDIKNIGTNQIHAFYSYLIGEENNINSKMIEKSISINSARQYAYSKLPSYFKRNNIPITFQKNEIPKENQGVKDKVWRNGDKRVSKDEKKECIKQIKDSIKSIRDKTILLCKISSSLDDVDLFNLKVRDYKRGYYEDYNVCYIEGYRVKVKTYFQTFFNSEACDMMSLYFKDRERKGETIEDNSWLFVSHKANKDGEYKKIKRTAFSDNLKETCQSLGIKNITPKSFRRWFNTELKRNRVDFEIVERMMGHKTQVSHKYQEVFDDIDSFLELYVEEIEAFTLLGNGGNKKLSEMDKKVEKLEIENLGLKTKLDGLNTEMKDLKELVKAIVNDQESVIAKKMEILEQKEELTK